MRVHLIIPALLLLAAAVPAQQYRLVGKLPAPSIKLTDQGGGQFDTREFAGKVIVYNLWFVGCPPCMEEIPKLNTLAEQYKDSDVVFLALSTSSQADIQKFLVKQPFSYRIVPDAGKAMLMNFGEVGKDGVLNVAFPTHIVINRDGYIEFKTTGIKGVAGVADALQRLAANK